MEQQPTPQEQPGNPLNNLIPLDIASYQNIICALAGVIMFAIFIFMGVFAILAGGGVFFVPDAVDGTTHETTNGTTNGIANNETSTS